MANLTREEIRKVFEYLEDENYEAIFEIIHDPILLVDPYEITDEQEDKILELISSKISIDDYDWIYADKELKPFLSDVIAYTHDSLLIQDYLQDNRYEFKKNERFRMIEQTRDTRFIEKMIVDSNNTWEDYQLYFLIKATNDAKFIQETIENKEIKLDTYMISDLLSYMELDFIEKYIKSALKSGEMKQVIAADVLIQKGNIKYIKDAIEDKEYEWSSSAVADLVAATKEEKYIREKLEDGKYDWNNYSLEEMIIATGNSKFIKSAIQSDKYNWYSDQISNLIIATHDKDFILKCVTEDEILKGYELPENDKIIRVIIPILDELSEEEKYNVFSKFREKGKKQYIFEYRKSKGIEYLKDNIENIMKMEGENQETIPYKKENLMKMYEVNNEVLEKIDFSILEPKYIDTLGLDKINQISCYRNIQEQVINLNESQLKVFSECIKHCRSTRWTPLAEAFLENASQYGELIEDILQSEEEIDFEKINIIIQDKNIFDIRVIDDVNNYELIRKEKCNEWIKSDSISQKKLAVLEKIYGQSLEYSEMIIKKYGQDIEKIQDGDYKDYIQSIKAILEVEDPSILEEIYENCKEIENIDKIDIEEGIKSEYGKLFNEGLFSVEQGEKIEEGIYDAGTDFKMIITSLGAFHYEGIDNYANNWNRPAIAAQHFCASYIRNDMIGTAPVNNICYRILRNVI